VASVEIEIVSIVFLSVWPQPNSTLNADLARLGPLAGG